MNPKIKRLASDFKNERGPFSMDNFPEMRLVRALGNTDKAGYISMFCTLDYNRRVDNLVDNIIELSSVDNGYQTNFFHAPSVVSITSDELAATFQSIGFRYPNRDASGWHHNCQVVMDTFDGKWGSLCAASGYHAPTLVHLVRKYDFKYLRGDKLAPFYARVVSDTIAPLEDVWELDIPVDTHIRRLSKELFTDDMSDDDIRERWREVGSELSISPHVVDGALWQTGYSWDDWGKDYWESL